MEPRIGFHMTVAKGLCLALEEADKLGCRTAQIFSKSPRSWQASPLKMEALKDFKALRWKLGIAPLAIHASYLINLASPSKSLVNKSIKALAEELDRAAIYEADFLVVHVGSSSTEIDKEPIIGRIVHAVHKTLELAKPNKTMLLLENMAGEKGDVGDTFEHLAAMLEGINQPRQVGICFDTCHAFQAGYDIRTQVHVDKLAQTIKETIGFDAIKVIHCNDSKKPFLGRADRHEHIGKGYIGRKGFQAMLRHPDFRKIPFILETPKDTPDADKENMALMRKLAG